MKLQQFFLIHMVTCFVISAMPYNASAQPGTSLSATAHAVDKKGLFDGDEILQITLRGNIKSLLKDKAAKPKSFSFDLLYTKEDSTTTVLPVQVKQRGHFRRLLGNCLYPPLLIDFPKEGPHLSSAFREHKKTKLVLPCKSDEYVIREWLVYKLYNLVTPESFRTRLVKVTMEDAAKGKVYAPSYGILLEEEKQMAKRNKKILLDVKLKAEQTDPNSFLNMTVFEYLIGNTDWSIQYLQNIRLIATDSASLPIPVPYDFDHAGIVDAPYAMPAEALQMTSIRQRRYRGYCATDLQVFDSVIAIYNRLKNDIYQLYTSCTLLKPTYIKSTIQYLDEFYKTINTPALWRKEFAYPCDKNGTGNVVIKGLKED